MGVCPLELRQLRHFEAVARLGGFGAAAEECRLSQPALSKSIRVLEGALGVPLFDRGPSGTQLTPYGERLLEFVRPALLVLAEARLEIDAMRGARRGRLNIGAITQAQRSLLPEAIKRFHLTYPEVDIQVNEELNTVLHAMLQAGQIDIAVVVRPEQALPDGIQMRLLLSTPVVLVVDPGHPVANASELSLAELTPYGWILPPRPEPERLRLEAMFLEEGLPAPQARLETTSAVFQTSLLAGTDRISYMSRTSGNLRDNGGRFVPLSLNRATWRRDICAIYRRGEAVRPTVKAFLVELERYGAEIAVQS